MSDGRWLVGVKDKFLSPCNYCQEGLEVCSCPNTQAFRTMLGHVIQELEKSWEAEATAWNRGYDVRRSMEKGRKS